MATVYQTSHIFTPRKRYGVRLGGALDRHMLGLFKLGFQKGFRLSSHDAVQTPYNLRVVVPTEESDNRTQINCKRSALMSVFSVEIFEWPVCKSLLAPVQTKCATTPRHENPPSSEDRNSFTLKLGSRD